VVVVVPPPLVLSVVPKRLEYRRSAPVGSKTAIKE
jgi:hypothetical protein